MADEFEFLNAKKDSIDLVAFKIPDDGYVKYLVEKGENYEFYIIVWKAGAETPYHCHPEGGCWMLMLSGLLFEHTVNGERKLAAGDQGFQKGAYGIHKITALEDSVSIHLYKPGALLAHLVNPLTNFASSLGV